MFRILSLLRVLAVGGAVTVTAGCQPSIETTWARETSLENARLFELVTVRKVVPLENRDLALGAIAKVIEQPSTGHLFVSDGGWSNRVYRFDSSGRFVTSTGTDDFDITKGRKLADFEITDSNIYLLTETLLLRTRLADGALLSSIRLPISALRLAVSGSSVCVITTIHGLLCGDDALTRMEALPTREVEFLKRHVYFSHIPISAASRTVIALAEFYSPSILLYDLASGGARVIDFPNSEWDVASFSRLWEGKERGEFSDIDQRDIQLQVRRMHKILPVPDGRVVLFDRQRRPARNYVVLFDPSTLKGTRFRADVGLLQAGAGKSYNIFDRLIGRSQTGLIGDISSNDIAKAVSTQWPQADACLDAWQCSYFLDFVKR